MRPRRPAPVRWPSSATSPTTVVPDGHRGGGRGSGRYRRPRLRHRHRSLSAGWSTSAAESLAQDLRHQRDRCGADHRRGHPPSHRAPRGCRLSLLGQRHRSPLPGPGWAPTPPSKAALETMVEAWRAEHPDVGFTRVIVGDCAGGEGASGTGFANGWDWDLAAELHPIWTARNLLRGSLIDVEEIVRWSTPCCGAGPAPTSPRWPSPPAAGLSARGTPAPGPAAAIRSPDRAGTWR